MPAWVTSILSDTNPYFYPAVFLSLLLAGLGLPISADLVLLTIGYVAWKGQASYAIVIPTAMAGILISDTAMFFIGKHLGVRLLGRWPFKKAFTPERMARAEISYRRQGYRVVFLARFMPGIRTVFMFTSGVLRLRYWKFIAYDFAGALIVVPLMTLSIKWAAGNQETILAAIRKGQWFILAGAMIAFFLWSSKRRRTRGARALTGSSSTRPGLGDLPE